jgi:altronate dehydratase
MPGDNVAIAAQLLPAGTTISYNGRHFSLDYTILEGHRFAVRPIASGEPLLSWGFPFGVASRDIAPGTYVCNAKVLQELRGRSLDFALPPRANFTDKIEPHVLDEKRFRPGVQVPRHVETRTFLGYPRSGRRGVGTRNYVVILGTTSRTASYARALEARLRSLAVTYEHIDGIVAVAHTEGGGAHQPHNLELVLRTLSGFMVHPNVGAVLAVDYGTEPVTNALLRRYMTEHDYPLADVQHHFLSLQGRFQADLEQGAAIVQAWLPKVDATTRCAQSLEHLKVALQCGGSDAFSGLSGNPLAAWVAKEIIRYGGTANLAETDELIGAEAYVLQNVRDLGTAHAFLATIERFKERVAWHGHTAEGNPSGGNMFRGLYNIVLKSLGAAMKRHPDVRLDYVIDYGERMQAPGFYFMDSPGNDLESIAGQVAAGATMIFFVTGNGAITNFPFVPTIKILTTTGRYELLAHDMDVNAGAYQDGTPLPVLGQHLLDLTVAVASGMRSAGEKAGHAQVSLWRDWPQTDASNLQRLQQAPVPTGVPFSIKVDAPGSRHIFKAIRTTSGHVTDQIGLILPTSLCSAEVARLIAARLNDRDERSNHPLSRFVALPHTEGCGAAGGAAEVLYARTMLGYLTHPMVKYGLLLEHGCEKTHNAYMTRQLKQMGFDPRHFGWASVQLDGGIERVAQKVEAWFDAALATTPPPIYDTVGLEALRLGLLTTGSVSCPVAHSLARLTKEVVSAGGTVVVPETTPLLSSAAYVDALLDAPPEKASLAYGQQALQPGLHVMETPTDHWLETLTGLGATGVEVMLAYIVDQPVQAHPMIPLLQVTVDDGRQGRSYQDLDLVLGMDANRWSEAMLYLILDVASHVYTPKMFAYGNTAFQMTRGLLGVSL